MRNVCIIQSAAAVCIAFNIPLELLPLDCEPVFMAIALNCSHPKLSLRFENYRFFISMALDLICRFVLFKEMNFVSDLTNTKKVLEPLHVWNLAVVQVTRPI